MKRAVLVILSVIFVVSLSFGAIKFKGDFIGVGDFKYMQSNYVYNNKPTDPYFGLDNVEFIVNLGTKLELTSDIYGMANLIIQPTTKFKHIAVDNLMISYFHKASKLKIVPFYRYRAVRFDDPENSIGWFNSWVISSSVFGIGNVTNSKVDNNGFYVDSSSPARAGGIPYILRPIEFMDGTIVSMPGMGEDTTNLSLVGRDVGGFYAEQKTRDYLWQVFLGAFFIDGSEGALNLAGAANVKIIDVFGIEDILSVSFGILGDFIRFSGASVAPVEFWNSYIYTIPNLRSFAALYNYGAYLTGDTEYADFYIKFLMNSQGQLFASLAYNEILKGGGYRVSGGIFIDSIPGMLIQLDGGFGSYELVTNTNVGVKPESASRFDVKAKVFGDYEIVFGTFGYVVEFTFFKENFLNKFNSIPYLPLSLSYSIDNGMIVKGGIKLGEMFEMLDVSLIGSFESIGITPTTNSSPLANVTTISVRGNLGFYLPIEGLVLNLAGGIFMWSDNLTSKGFVPATQKKDLNLMYFAFSPNIVYSPQENVSFRVGYGYPMFGDMFDIDYGTISDALSMRFYKNKDNLLEGIYGWYVLQNLPRIYIDLKISF